MEQLFNWFYDLVMSISVLWDWLVTPISILGVTIAPIYLIGGSMLIIGILRAIVGVI